MRYELQYDGRGEGYFLSREAAHGHARELAAGHGRRLDRFRVVPVTHGRLNLAGHSVGDVVFVDLKSHRARENFVRFLGRKPKEMVDWDRGMRHVYLVTRDEWLRFVEQGRAFHSRWHGSVKRTTVKDPSRLTDTWPSDVDRAGPLGEPEVDPRIYGDPAVPFAAQHWYSGQGDPLYALASTGWPQPLSTAEWALANAMRARSGFDAAMRRKYGKKRRRWSSEDHDADDQLRELEEGLTESVRRRSAQEWY
jgi:hypothetical protein